MCIIFIIVSGMSSPHPSWNICSGTSFYLQEGKWITSIIASRSIATRAETPVATVLQTRTPTQTSDMCFVLCFCAVGVCFLCVFWCPVCFCRSCAFCGFFCLVCLALLGLCVPFVFGPFPVFVCFVWLFVPLCCFCNCCFY